MKYDNVIRARVPAEEPRKEILYGIAYNGDTAEAIDRVIADLQKQKELMLSEGL